MTPIGSALSENALRWRHSGAAAGGTRNPGAQGVTAWIQGKARATSRSACGAAAGPSPTLPDPPPQAGEGVQASRALAILAVVDEVAYHGRLGQRRGVTEIAVLVLGDLAQDAPHDLAGAGLGQTRRELDEVGRGDRADLLAHPGDELLAQFLGGLLAGHQGHICVDALALDVVGIA